jgi:hypothetical protein
MGGPVPRSQLGFVKVSKLSLKERRIIPRLVRTYGHKVVVKGIMLITAAQTATPEIVDTTVISLILHMRNSLLEVMMAVTDIKRLALKQRTIPSYLLG